MATSVKGKRRRDKRGEGEVRAEDVPDDALGMMSALSKGKSWRDAVMRKFFGKSGEEVVQKLGKEAPKAPKVPWRDIRFHQALRDDYHYMTQLHSDRLAQRNLAEEDAYARIRLESEYGQYSKVFEREILSQSAGLTPASTIPEIIGDFAYYATYPNNNDMAVYCRKSTRTGEEQILVDTQALLNQHKHLSIGSVKLNADQSKIIILLDTDGSETFSVLVKDLSTNTSSTEISGISNAEWAPDGKSYYYTEPDTKKRPAKIYHHVIGTPRSQDHLIFSEDDDQFFVDVARTKDRKYMTINSNSKTTSEIRIVDASSPTHAPPTLVMSKRVGTEFFLDHSEKHGFIIITAENSSSSTTSDANYKIMRCDDSDIGDMKKWEALLPASDTIKVDDLDVFENHLVIYERHNGAIKIRVFDMRSKESKYVPLEGEGIGQIEPGSNLDPASPTIRFTYSSPITAGVTYDYHLSSGQLEEKRRVVVGKAEGARSAFDPSSLTLKRVFVDSTNGAKVPLTLVHRHDIQPSADTPTLLLAYGAYGHNLETGFDATLLPLMERGWCIAYAHIRGGGELGLKWYHEGKLLKKRNSFDDLQACVQYLFDQRITAPAWLVGKAASAGGLPFAVMANEQPDTFKALLLRNPFVDVTTTMLDPSLPLTVHEYDEWGNPTQPDAFHNIFSYDPYYNLKPQPYPHMFIQSSAIDARVPCWNHARYVAKLRSLKTDKNDLLLTLDSTFGHFGDASSSGVAGTAAKEWSFIFSSLNIVPSRI